MVGDKALEPFGAPACCHVPGFQCGSWARGRVPGCCSLACAAAARSSRIMVDVRTPTCCCLLLVLMSPLPLQQQGMGHRVSVLQCGGSSGTGLRWRWLIEQSLCVGAPEAWDWNCPLTAVDNILQSRARELD